MHLFRVYWYILDSASEDLGSHSHATRCSGKWLQCLAASCWRVCREFKVEIREIGKQAGAGSQVGVQRYGWHGGPKTYLNRGYWDIPSDRSDKYLYGDSIYSYGTARRTSSKSTRSMYCIGAKKLTKSIWPNAMYMWIIKVPGSGGVNVTYLK